MKHSVNVSLTLTATSEADLQAFVAAVQSALENMKADQTNLGFVGEDEAEITIEEFGIDEDQ